MPYLVKTNSSFHLKKIRFLRSLKIYSRRIFYILLAFCICGVALYISSVSFRTLILGEINKYSTKFEYVIKGLEIYEKNTSEYCVNLKKKDFITKYKNLSTVLFSVHDLKKELENIDCVENVNIRKIFPFKMKMDVSYKIPMAIWQKKQKFYFMAATGEVMKIRNNKNIDKFVLISGNNTPENVMSLLKFIAKDKEIYNKISMAVWVGDRRWNIIFNNGTKLMLPEDSPENAWVKFRQLQQAHKNFKNFKYKVIDLRIASKIYVQ